MTNTKKILISMAVASSVLFTACSHHKPHANHGKSHHKHKMHNTILESYASMALDNYSDALNDAVSLQKAIESFAINPTNETLEATKDAWLVSRESYGQTEAFRLANGPIDAEDGWVADTYGSLEGQLNAWPLDENMIDYTIDANGKKTSGNIIDTKGVFTPGGVESTSVDVTNINVEAITALNENGGEANVATGYHAIEFLLWGQDQDYGNFVKDSITNGALESGARPLSDFTSSNDAQRRIAYLKAASQKIVEDLSVVKSAWENNVYEEKGLYKAALLGKLTGQNSDKNLNEKEALKDIISGLGVFIKSELANERIAVAVLTPSEEDEHSCFSDNTHRDIATNYQGFKNILTSTYNGKKYGASLLDKADKETKHRVFKLMKSIESKIAIIDETAKTKAHFDYQIRPDSLHAKNIVKLKNEMRKLGDMMVEIANANGISLTTDDVTDAEETKI